MLHNLRNLLILSILSGLSLGSGGVPEEEVRHGTGSWDPEAYGNHRAVIRVTQQADAVRMHIPWRRRDVGPEKKNVIFIDAAKGSRIRNICPIAVNRECGDFIFQPDTAPGYYYVYFMPCFSSGRSNYPTVHYQRLAAVPDFSWLARNGLSLWKSPAKERSAFARAQIIEIQSIDEFNSFFPMEVIATAEETGELVANHPEASYLLFPEERRFPIRMTDDLPARWMNRGPKGEFVGEALRGEFYAFQVGIYACREAIEDLDVVFSDLKWMAPAPPSGQNSSSSSAATTAAAPNWSFSASFIIRRVLADDMENAFIFYPSF